MRFPASLQPLWTDTVKSRPLSLQFVTCAAASLFDQWEVAKYAQEYPTAYSLGRPEA